MSKLQVYCAVYLDGLIAGPDDDLSWLGTPDPNQAGEHGTIGFAAFLKIAAEKKPDCPRKLSQKLRGGP